MTGESLRVGVIGVGFGAKVHLPAFASVPGSEVVAVADGGSGRARAVARVLGGGVRVFDSWKRLVETAGVDAISVATPPSSQADVVCAALASGKHVLCEKPFGRDQGEARRMCETLAGARRVGAVGFQFRMEPGIVELKRLVEAGAVGRIRRIDVAWLTGSQAVPGDAWSWKHDAELGGGVVNAYGSHVVDYVQWLSGSAVVSVLARSEILVPERRDGEGRARRVTAEDGCDVVCELGDGVVANLRFSSCCLRGAGHRIEIHGERGRLVFVHEAPFAPGTAEVRIHAGSEGVRVVDVPTLPYVPGGDTRIPAFRQLAVRFVHTALGRASADFPDFWTGLGVRRVLDAILESARHVRRAVVA